MNMFWFYDIKYYPLSRHCTQYLPQLEFPLWWAGALAKTCFINKRTQTFIKNIIIEVVCMMSVKQGDCARCDVRYQPM